MRAKIGNEAHESDPDCLDLITTYKNGAIRPKRPHEKVLFRRSAMYNNSRHLGLLHIHGIPASGSSWKLSVERPNGFRNMFQRFHGPQSQVKNPQLLEFSPRAHSPFRNSLFLCVTVRVREYGYYLVIERQNRSAHAKEKLATSGGAEFRASAVSGAISIDADPNRSYSGSSD
ncbi:hypothetical protein L596_027240 [Steinernema carpocapsae]|uniref:Uncharacterized protein n=1 Tax=Steinernema carpocapsae TaxID=34508 RepID=A0A4V5ZYE6_STECR|nr:hypothetical protein L596_027240 [Steinernema carpocapsae]